MKKIFVIACLLIAGCVSAVDFTEKDLKANNFTLKMPAFQDPESPMPVLCRVIYTSEKPVEVIFKPAGSAFRYRTKRLPAAQESKEVIFSMLFFPQIGIETIVEVRSRGKFDIQKFRLLDKWGAGDEQFLGIMRPDAARKNNNRHKAIKKDYSNAAKNPVVLFGDSLTDNWRGKTFDRMREIFGANGIVNAGICGDRIEHLLWRMYDMADLLKANPPSVAVFFIGTNNGGSIAREIYIGMGNLLKTFREYCPETKIIVLGLAPKGLGYKKRGIPYVDFVNSYYRTLANWKDVIYYDFPDELMNPIDRSLKMEYYTGDALHFSEKGYAEVLTPHIAGIIKLVQSERTPSDFFLKMAMWSDYLLVRQLAATKNQNLEELLCCETHIKDLASFWRTTMESVLKDPAFVPVMPPEYLRQEKEEGFPAPMQLKK